MMAQRPAKYTQDFIFEGEGFGSDYVRAVVERSCEAVSALMQDLFAAADRIALEDMSAAADLVARERATNTWSEILSARPVLEITFRNAVLCAYADMVNGAAARKANLPVVEVCLRSMEDQRCDRLDLEIMLGVGDVLAHAIDCDRPLLVRLSAQLGVLFGWGESQITCNPLSPVTLTAGFLAGLLCVDISPVSKRLLLQAFEKHCLSRLAVLISGMITRLEEEQLPIRQGAGFEEDNAGPIARVLDHPARVDMDDLYTRVDAMYEELAKHRTFPAAIGLYELTADASLSGLVDLLGEIRYELKAMAPRIARHRSSGAEYLQLQQARLRTASILQEAMRDRRLPPDFVNFFRSIWPDVLFYQWLVEGEDSENWQNLLSLQDRLIESICPIADDAVRRELAKTAPTLARTLRQTLEQSGFAFAEIAPWLEQLKTIQLQNAQNKLDTATLVDWQPLPVETAHADDVIATPDQLAVYDQVLQTAKLAAYI